MAIDFNKLRKKPVQEESTDIDSLIDSVFAEDNVQEPVAEVQEQPKVVQEQPKEAEQPREGGFWNTYLGDTIEKIGAGLQNFSANTYGLLDKGARKINDLVGDTRGAHTDATGKAQSGFFGEVGKAAKESVTDLRAKSDRYKGKNFVELWKDDKAAAVGDVFLQASESLPQSLMAAFTGPLGIASIGATVANEKYDQLDENNPNMGESQKMLNALLTGTAEAGSEYLGSVPVGKWLKGMYSKMGAKAAEEQLQKGLTGWIGTNAKKLGVLFPPVAEGVEEIASQVAENITDWATGARPDLNPMEGAFESFVYGAGGGAQFSAMSLPAYGAKLANKAKTGYEFRKATKEFSNLFEDESVDDVVAGLSSMTPEEQKQWLSAIRLSDYTDDQKIAASRLLTTTLERNAARSPEEYASMREEGERMLIDSEMKRFEAASKPYISDNGRYQQVKLGEEDVFITGGTVGYKQNEFGEYVLDLDTTSEELYYVDSEGNTQVTTGKAITEIVDIADYEQEYNEYLQHVTNAVKQRNQLQESISQEVTIENGDPVQYMGPDGNLIDGIAADTSLPEVITLEDGTVVPRENVIPNTQGAAINPPADLQTEQPTAQTGLQTEQPAQQTVQPVQDGTQVVEQPVQTPVFPVDKNNNIDYSQISEPEMYAQALQSEFDNEAIDVIDEQIQSAQARLDKASKNTDAIARRRAMKVEQAEVERLNKVKEILTPVQQSVSETALEASGNANPLQAGQNIMSEEELSMLTEPERRVYVAENSNDPLELADLYEQVKDETEYSEMLPWQAALLGRRVNKDSFVEHSDKNNITGAIAKSWFADKESGKKAGLDVIAAELSEYGIPVTENDIVEFILEHPGNSVKKRSKVSMTAERRFKQLIKDLTGENVGGLESNSGRLVLAGLRAGVRAEQEKQALPYDMFTIPDSIVNFFEETGLNPDDFNSFEELNDAVQRELESGTFVFPLGPTDLQTINNIVQHGIKQQANYTDFASRIEKAGTQRAAQQPIFETAAGTQLEPITIEPRTEAGTESTEAGTTEQVTGEEIEYTPEDMAEIDAAIETRPLIEVIQEAAVVNEINEAEKDVDVEPTEAQKEAGNYKKGHIKLNGFDITIENPKGSQRSGIDADGKKWSIEMANSYGYIKGTKGKDNDQVDIFLGDSPLSDKVFVVDQVNKDGSFDEHKCMIGFNTIEEAESAYLSNYEKGWTGLGSITEMPVDEFREWVKEGKKVEPASEEVVVEEQPQSTKTALEIAKEEAKKLDKKKTEPKKVDLIGVFDALNTKGETKLSDHVEDKPKAKKQNEGQFGLVSDSRMEELKKRLRSKGSQLNVGMDPEILSLGIELAAGYLDRGIYRINDFAKQLIEDVGDSMRPYIKAFYNGARDMPEVVNVGLDKQMDSYDTVRAFDAMGFVPVEVLSNEGKRAFVDAVKAKLGKDAMNIVSLRKMAAESGLTDVKDTTIQEYVELALIEKAKEIANEDISTEERYQKIVDLYNNQPTISMRSSERIEKQQYSTPLPMSFLAGEYVKTIEINRALEPSSGNGMMVFNVPTEKVIANEIDEVRLDNLREQPFLDVMNQDATTQFNIDPVDAIVMNPPFGKSEARDYDGYKIAGLDEQMVVNALSNLKPDGKASIIIGGHTKYKENGTLASEKAFFGYLYNYYNVTDVINIDGSLYSKQGTSFPVRMILINGRRKDNSRVYAPLQKDARAEVVTTFEELYNRVNENIHETDLLLQEPTVSNNDGTGVATGGTDGGPSGNGNTKTGRQGGKRGGESSTPSSGPDLFSGHSDKAKRHNSDTNADGRNLPHSTGSEKRADVYSRQGVDRRVREQDVLQFLNRTNELGGNDVKVDLESEKTKYPAKSKSGEIGSVVPTNVAQPLANVLSRFKDIDSYVQTKLGYPSKEDLYNALAAEQIDSVAMAIYQIENGKALIIGDMTGVGKGRQAAAIIRYATLEGKKPIFITEKAHLFSDMYRDLLNIGSGALVPFMLNSKSQKSDPTITDKDGVVVYKPLSEAKKNPILKSGKLPDEYDYIMLTYSQLNTDREKGSVKQSFISRMAEGNIIVMDESHNAGGDGNTGAFLRDVLPTTKGVAFLSGTFAKRPDNMPIYALKTSMNEANMSNDELIEAIAKGGVPLQEIMSKNLVESGQMVRRERDFTGVNIDWLTLDESKDEHYKAFDAVIEMFNELIAFQNEYISPIISGINEDLADTQGEAGFTKGTKDLGVSNTPFASKTFNVVRQLLFSLKAKDVARYAIEELKAGKKPVIAVSNTMEGFMNELGAIDEVLTDYDFSITLKKGLDGQFRYTEGDAFGKKTQKRIELSELPREGQEKYHELVERIDKMSSGITISPIDVIRDTIEKAGYRVGELTGRTNQLEFNNDGTAVIKKRTETDKKKLARDFNSGELDALILNQSASTGISLHASAEFKDQKPRVMISAQTQLDVNTEVQMRGRVDRTGQVHRGEYKYICSPIPAEQRLVMMFKAKLKSLDANTTSNQKSKANDIDIVDFLNKYGDEVCIEYLKENPEINEKMLDPEGISGLSEDELAKLKTREGAASKVAGRAALLSVAEQEQFYKEVSEKYMNIINYLNDNNSNDLEITTLPLRAETKESVVVVKGVGTVGNPFAQDSIRETVEMDVLKKPMKADEVKAEIERLTGGLNAKEYKQKLINEIELAQEEHIKRERLKGEESFKKKQDALREKKYKEGKKKGLEGDNLENFVQYALSDQHSANAESEALRLKKIELRYDSVKKIFNMFPTGRILMVPNSLNIGATTTYTEGVLMGYKIKPGQYSPSSITASFATLDSRRRVDIPLSKFDFLNAVYSETMQNIKFIKTDLSTWDSRIPTKTRRTGYIVTGNVLQAYGVIEGQLVSYSTVDGGIKQGILLPENYEPKGQKKRVMITESINDLLSGMDIADSSGDVKLEKEGSKGYAISVPLSKVRGGKYFLDEGLRSFVVGGDFKQMGNKMVGYIKESNIKNAVNYLSERYSLTTDVTIDDVRFKDMADVNRAFNTELQMQIDDVLPKGHIYKLGMPSDVLLSAGIPNLPIEMNSDKLSDKSKQNNHPFDLSKVMNLPNAIHSPIAVFDSKTQPGSKVILTEITSGEKNFVVAIRAQKHKTSGRRTLLVNEIRSLYPKDTQQISKWIESGELMRWVDKEKAINWLGKQQFNSADVAIPYDSSTAANIVNSFDNPTLDNGNILSEIELLSSSLNTPVRVVRDISEIKDSDKDLEKRMLRSRGWYDTRTGEVVIVLANNKSVAEAQSTIMHEVVGHMGLRKLLGRDFNQTMSSIYDSLPKDVQKSLMDKYGSKLVAAEEYASEMAETLSDPGIVQRIASAFKQAMRKLGINLKMTDGDIMTLLWKSKNRLTDGDSAADIVRKMGKEDKVKSEARVFDRVFRDGTLAEAIEETSNDPIIKQRMHAAVKSRSFQLQEGYQDRMLAVKKMQQLLEEQKGTKLPDYMNVYMFENTLSSRNTYEIEQYNENYYKPMMESITAIIKNGDTLRDVEDYAIAKHGIERNDLFRLNALKEEIDNLAKNNAYLEWLPDDVRSDSKKFQDRVEGDKQMLLEEIGEGKFSDIEGLSIEPFESLRKKLGKKDYAGLTALEAEYDAPASEIVKSFESRNEKYIDGLWKSINNATKASLKKWFDSGMITKDTFNKINGMYSHYVPLRGFAEETASDVYEYFTEQESAFNSPLRKADGRKSKPETPFAHILSMAGSSIVGGNKNIMKLHLLRLAQAHPSDYMTADKTWYVDNGKVDPETGKPMYDPVFPEYSEDIETYRQNVEAFEMEMNELREQGIAFKGVKKLKPGYKISKIESSEHMVRAVLNGEEYHILVHGDPRVAQAVNGINDKGRQESAFMKKIAWANRQMAANFTTRNPAFIASNLVRDVIFASTALSIKEGSSYTMKFEKNIFGGAGGALKRFLQGKPDMSKQEDVYLKEFLENGGETGHTALYNIDKYKKMVEKDARQGKKADARKKYMSVIDFFANGARWAEDLSRFSVYMASRQSGRSVLRSVSDAKEVTVNFNRKGSGSYGAGYARAAYLFFNAAVQSLSNAAVLMKDNPVKGTAALMSYASVGVLIPAIIASLGDDDDLERYNNLPDYVRKNHLCIPVGDMFVKIPLPIELRAFYGLGDQMYRTLSGLDGMGESLANIALSFMDLLPLNPSGGGDVLGNILPDATVPFYESYYSNKDFTGKPIAKITPFNEFDPEYKRVYKSANAVPVYVSQFLNSLTGGDEVKRGVYDKALGRFANPASFEHLFGSYFGGLWTTLNHVYKSTENVVKAAVQEDFDAGENQVWRTAPILNRFVDEGKFNGSLGKVNERYFDAVREMRETKHLIKGYEDKLGEQLTASEAAKVAAKISDIMKGDQAKRMYIIEDYSKHIESLNKELQDLPREKHREIADKINVLKSRMLERLKEIK